MTAKNLVEPATPRPIIALLGAIPADVAAALGQVFDLIGHDDLQTLTERQRETITRGLTSAMGGVNHAMAEQLPGLEAVASVGAGMDRFDLPWLSERGIALHPTPDVMTEDTAEFAVGLIFALLRNIVSNDGFVRRGAWAAGRAPLGYRISGRKIGIVGLGRIGSRIAGKLTALGCDVAYSGPRKKDTPWRFEPDLAEMAQKVDVLVLSCAGGEATRGIIDAEILGQLGPQGYLVNVSRGSVVDEKALIEALERKTIAGAALDVFENEPSLDPRFPELQNCILQPHASVFTRENRRDLVAALEEILRS
ncbi:NAD(P)-dependent oxidoreductase [Nisaea sp.]|uniref:NAD(P)-dependent oxidoreductase n=2 Tax=Nisaea sp. TaxID=2024842 RepID=UPI0032675E77